MKSLGGRGGIVTAAGIPVEDALRYVLSLPIATLVCGIDSEKVLDQNLKIAREFQPMTSDEMAAVEARYKTIAGDGRYELFKTAQNFDGVCAPQAARFRDLRTASRSQSFDGHARARQENDGIATGTTVVVTVDEMALTVPQTVGRIAANHQLCLPGQSERLVGREGHRVVGGVVHGFLEQHNSRVPGGIRSVRAWESQPAIGRVNRLGSVDRGAEVDDDLRDLVLAVQHVAHACDRHGRQHQAIDIDRN